MHSLRWNSSTVVMHELSDISKVAASALVTNRSLERQQPGGMVQQWQAPNLFVAVFTTRKTPIEKRNAIRNLWRAIDGGPGYICARFILCDAQDQYSPALFNENAANGDLLVLPCAEGYAQGLLTKKVISVMKVYRAAALSNDPCLNRPLFMKVDDDTFVGGHKFREGLTGASQTYGELIYAGVDLPAQPATRDPSSQWYEPWEVWPYQNYPAAMYGGPGYILGRSMIQRIVDEAICDQYILWNEDRAVGVWVDVLKQKGLHVNWVRVPGTNGFWWDHPVKSGLWGQYPYVLAHHLSAPEIGCLSQLDVTANPNAPTEPCFALGR